MPTGTVFCCSCQSSATICRTFLSSLPQTMLQMQEAALLCQRDIQTRTIQLGQFDDVDRPRISKPMRNPNLIFRLHSGAGLSFQVPPLGDWATLD